MPYCVQCGAQVGSADTFCGKCGRRQVPDSGGHDAGPLNDALRGVSARNASLLCYIPVVGWIGAIVVLASARFRGDATVRFHAFQGLYLFVAWLIVDWVLAPMMHFGVGFQREIPNVFRTVVLVAWIFMLVKVSQNERFRLPVLGELAEKSVSEQR